MEMQQFFSNLGARMDDARENNMHRYQQLFNGLKPQLDAARDLERELNRHLAYRFNVLDYVRTDELGLSRIIADLLNPRASHGQGPLFLKALLGNLNVTEGWAGLRLDGARVSVERVISDQRRIDVYVRIPGGGGYCLAIENKPYAGDQKNQVRDYLEHLAREYKERFLLIYLSPAGEAPSDWSLPAEDLGQWTGRFLVMSYHDKVETVSDEEAFLGAYEAFRDSLSLTDWLSECYQNCQVERLRWFLRDALLFCQRTFGDHHMTTDSEARAVEEYLLSNSDSLAVAQAVYESWPAVRDKICKNFLEHLRSCIEEKAKQRIPDYSHDIEVGCRYDVEKRNCTRLWLYRKSWVRYETRRGLDSKGRTWISFEADSHGPNRWCYGVRSPKPLSKMTDAEQDRRKRLHKALKTELALGKRSDWWPQWKWTRNRMRHWNSLVPELFEELKAREGEITDYFVDAVLDTAVKAIPVINEIEGGQD